MLPLRSILVLLLLSVPQLAAAQSECDAALVQSSYKNLYEYQSDWRLAKYVTEEVFNERKMSASAEGELFDVPLKGSFDDYKAAQQRLERQHNESMSLDEARNIFWTGLDENAVTAYTACLDAIANRDGLYLQVVASDDDTVIVMIRLDLPGVLETQLSWTEPVVGGQTLITTVKQGTTNVSIPRTGQPVVLAANIDHYASNTVTVLPLVQPIRKPKAPCLFENSSGECLVCGSTWNQMFSNGTNHRFYCPGMLSGQSFVSKTKGVVRPPAGGSSLSVQLSMTYPDGTESSPLAIHSDTYHAQNFAIQSGIVEVPSMPVGSSFNIISCSANVAGGCLSYGRWQICDVRHGCEWIE
jgi:hypothetical protein